MRRLEIATFCKTNRMSRSDGARLREEIEDAWRKGELITLDFANVRIASVSFFDESIGLLAREHSLDKLKDGVHIENLDAADRALLNRIVTSRSRERVVNNQESVAPGR